MGERVVHPAVDEDTVLFVGRVGADALGHERVDVVLARGAEDFHRQRHLEAAKLKGESGDQLRVVTLPVILADHDDAVVVQLGEQVLRRRLAELPQIILHPIGDERHREGEDQSSEGAVHDFLPR